MSTRHFCCCIPVRVAVFVTSLSSLLFSGIVAAVAYFVLIKTRDSNNDTVHLTTEQKVAFGIVGGVYTLIALISLFGFIGSIIRKRKFVSAYSKMLYVVFVLQCVASGYLIYSLFNNIGKAQCKLEENGTVVNCKDLSGATKGVIIGCLIVQIIIHAYIVVIIKRYVKQLDQEQSFNRTSGQLDSAFKMGPTNQSYYPHQPLDQNEGLLAPQGHYAYSDPHHSFGS